MVALQHLPITEHERRFVIFAQVLCVGRSVTSLLSVTPAGVPVGRRAASRRPDININKNPVCIYGNAAKFRNTERTNPFPTKFVDIVRINGNAVRKGKVAPSQSLRDSSPKGRALGNSRGNIQCSRIYFPGQC